MAAETEAASAETTITDNLSTKLIKQQSPGQAPGFLFVGCLKLMWWTAPAPGIEVP
jgi:hypothetical protein